MAITATCQQCGKQYRVGDQLAGKKVKCKNCGGVFAIPLPDAPAGEELLDFSAMAELEQPAAQAAPAPSRRASAKAAPTLQPQSAAPAEAEAPKESASNNAFYALRALLVVIGVIAVVAITLKFYIDSARSYARQPRVVRVAGKPGKTVKVDPQGKPIPPKPMRGKEIMETVWLEIKLDAPADLRQAAEEAMREYVMDQVVWGKVPTEEFGHTQIVASWKEQGTEEVVVLTADGQSQKVTLPAIIHDVSAYSVGKDADKLLGGEHGPVPLGTVMASDLKMTPGQDLAAAVKAHCWQTIAKRVHVSGTVGPKQPD